MHENAMKFAIKLAQLAHETGERPFGCVILDPEGAVIGKGSGTGSDLDPTDHSELQAIREACEYMGGLLQGCTLVSTHEPCMMCTGAILHSKVSAVVWGSSRVDLPQLFRPYRDCGIMRRFNDTTHPPQLHPDVLRQQCVDLFAHEVKELIR
jgi:tRNA(adenine34) deaminase